MKPEESLYFLQAAQALARYHQALGIDHYPITARLSNLAQTPPACALRAGKRLNPNPIDSKPSDKITRPSKATPIDSGQATTATAADLGDLPACRLCADDDVQPLTARAGRVGQTPKLYVVGDYRHDENPDGEFIFGQEEDELLAKMLAAIALGDEDVGITNLVKCCPLKDKATGDWSGDGAGDAVAERCLAHLRRQILAARPRLILAMGNLPARILTGKKTSLSALRGRLHNFFPRENQPVPVLVSYHPAFLLTQIEMKKAAWDDLKMARRFLASLPLTAGAAGR